LLPREHWSDRPWRHASNRAGGVEGGVTNGEDVIVRGALKPISTLPRPLPSADLLTAELKDAFYERSDVCVVPAAGVIGEAMVAMVLADAVLDKFGGDHLRETLNNFKSYMQTIGPRGEP
jgi:chorismate synthase